MNKKLLIIFGIVFLLSLLVIPTVNADITKDMFMYFNMTNTSTTAYDLTGRFTGTGLNGLVFTGDATSRYIDVDDGAGNTDLQINNASGVESILNGKSWSASWWINPDDFGNDDYSWSLVDDTTQKIGFDWTDGAGGNSYRAYINGAWEFGGNTNIYLTAGNWWNIVATFDNSSGDFKIYYNGVVRQSSTANAQTIGANPHLIVGGHYTSGGVDAQITNFALWNRTLNSTEIALLNSSGRGYNPVFPATNFSIIVKNKYNNSDICNFSAKINSINYNSNVELCKLTTSYTYASPTIINITLFKNSFYNQTYLNVNTSSDYTGYLYQSIVYLNATELITGNALTGGIFTAGVLSNASFLFVNAGKINITYAKSGYLPTKNEFTFTALTNTSRTITGVYNSILNVTANDYFGGAINNFTANATLNGSVYFYSYQDSTTNGYLEIPVLKNLSYNIFINPFGYELSNTTKFINALVYNHTFILYTTNSISFLFKDVETGDLVENVSIELISDVFSTNTSTSNGSIYLDLLSPTDYTIRYNSPQGYSEGLYYFNLQNRTHTNLTLYLVSNTTSTQVTATVIDQYSSYLEGAYIKVLRYDIVSNNYLLQQIAQTNFEGKAILNIILNTEYYKFIIEYPFGTVRQTTNPTYIYATTINFQINTGTELLSDYWNTQDVYVDLSFNNETNNFRYTYSDANNIASQGCLYVYTYTIRGLQLYNSSCVSSASGTILVGVANTTGTTYIAKSYISFGTDTYFMGDHSYTFPTSQPMGRLGVFIILILTFIVAMTSYYSKTMALVLTPMPMLIGAIMGIGISVVMAILIEIVCIIIAVIISKN